MKEIRCPYCDEPLPEDAQYCAMCGKSITDPEQTVTLAQNEGQEPPRASQSDRPPALRVHHLYPLGNFSSTPSTPRRAGGSRRPATINASRTAFHSPFDEDLASRSAGSARSSASVVEQESEDDQLPGNLFVQRQEVTWQKDVESTHAHTEIDTPPLSERPVTPRPILLAPSSKKYWPFRSNLLFWVTTLVTLMLVLGGIFGVLVTFGRGFLKNQTDTNELTLMVTPSSLEVGATMTLHGTNFTPNGQVGLSRDASIALVDTGGTAVITTDAHGSFTDTVVVGSDWGAGQHLINAEDATHHKVAQFPIIVTGQGQSLRPAHLGISPTSLDLGAGDTATNSTQMLTLSNLGGGQISWKASADASWVQLSPLTGSFASTEHDQITVAVDRAGLPVGPYKATLSITSNAGNALVPIQMQVTPLNVAHEAALQLNPAVLTFTGVDGGQAPASQTVTIGDPGVQPLSWSATTSTPWLSFSPQTGQVASGGSQKLTVAVNISTLLPGTYHGVITVSGQGNTPVQDSPQNINVTVTVLPQCALQVAPGGLTFASIDQQAGPAPQTLNVGPSSSCSGQLQWNASSSASWLSISSASGTTPSSPQVSINVTGLQAGTYNGAITFSSSAGTQMVPVTFTLAPPTLPLLQTGPGALNFNGVLGQGNPPAQTFTITNIGGGTLNWQAQGATAVGGGWLNVAPASGSLGANQSATVSVGVATLNSLVPGTYNGSVAISGTDGSGNVAGGSPQMINITFNVQAPCSIATSPGGLDFTTVVGQNALPATQALTINANGTCAHALNWTATPSANAPWLSATPATGAATLNTAGVSNIGANPAGLAAGVYHGTVTVTAVDSATQAPVGTPQTVAVTLTVQPPCTLQGPSASQLTFTAEAGSNPAAQTLKISATGACAGGITVTPTLTLNSGTGWLTVTPATANLASGGSASFTVTVTSTALTAGSYTAAISLGATNGGVPIAGSPQTVGVALTVNAVPALAVAPGSLTINTTTGNSSTPLTISNTGGSSLNWTATLAKGAPSFVSLSAGQGTNVNGGANQTLNVVVDATGLPGGSTYNTSVTISAVDSSNNQPVGNPITIAITINVAPPAMQLDTTALTYNAQVGTNPAAQMVTLTNTGGDGLTWTVGTPSATWLTVVVPNNASPTASGANVSLSFNVDTTGLVAGTYSATVVITPSVGTPATVTVTLNVLPPPTPPPSPSPTPPTPTPTVSTPTPTPTAIPPTPTPSPTSPSPTPTSSIPTPTPTVTSPSPTPTSPSSAPPQWLRDLWRFLRSL
jgi:hypothetical protein